MNVGASSSSADVPVIVVSRNGSDEKPPKSEVTSTRRVSSRLQSSRLQDVSVRIPLCRERSRSPVRFAPRFPRDRCKLPTRTKMSPFVFFVMKCYEEYKKKHSNTAVPIKEISRKCSQKWKRMSDEERRYYELAQDETECGQMEVAPHRQSITLDDHTAIPPPPPVPAFELLEGGEDVKPQIEKLNLPVVSGTEIQRPQKTEPLEHCMPDTDPQPGGGTELTEDAQDVKPQVEMLNHPTVSVIETREPQPIEPWQYSASETMSSAASEANEEAQDVKPLLENFHSPTVSVFEVQEPQPLEPWMYNASEPQSSTASGSTGGGDEAEPLDEKSNIPTTSAIDMEALKPTESLGQSASGKKRKSNANGLELVEEELLESEGEESDASDSSDWIEDEEQMKEMEKEWKRNQPWERSMLRFSGGRLVPEDLVRKAVEYHWSRQNQRARPKSSTSTRFRFLRTGNDYHKLRMYRTEGLDKINKAEALKIITHRLKEIVEERTQAGISLNTNDIHELAHKINRNLVHPIPSFSASKRWICRFREKMGLSCRSRTKRGSNSATAKNKGREPKTSIKSSKRINKGDCS